MSSYVLELGRVFAAPTSFRAALIAAGADSWSFWKVRRHMAAQVDNPILKALTFAFGRRALAVSLFPALALLALGPDVQDNSLIICGILLYLMLIFALFRGNAWRTRPLSHNLSGYMTVWRQPGQRDKVFYVPEQAVRLLDNVHAERPDAKFLLSFVGKDPILWIAPSAFSLFAVPAKIWDVNEKGEFTSFVSPN
ncbi:MAG TPA: hypothetical protein VHD55_02815 [Candidatus Paceibacterota bacterium]|nr:hypothetical protein [Candidatus Paceibacterota bacterium]